MSECESESEAECGSRKFKCYIVDTPELIQSGKNLRFYGKSGKIRKLFCSLEKLCFLEKIREFFFLQYCVKR